MPKTVHITESIQVGAGHKLLLIAGPCQLESLEHALMIADSLKEYTAGLPVQLVFKSSFDKANRSSLKSSRGPGIEDGLQILAEVKKQTGLPVLTDIHLPEQASMAAEVVDVLQIPAFLCRQTDLLTAAGRQNKAIHVKKGQFLHPADMKLVAEKIASTGNENIMLCERGTSFGYRDLVVDIRSLLIMRESGYPVIFDATHSVQTLGGSDGVSGGQRKFIAALSRAAAAAGIDGVFIECHDNPNSAPSDAASMVPLRAMPQLLESICKIREAARKFDSFVIE
ncbi:MAG: 3-deoxy-8-phosphooctulonate synthase [Candidatus Dadabacteria bacterium]|nr:MAG: 3-deoxy-8-phosphooctulonate synthase [Candidatus Dadabacteria bacterium]